MRYPTAAITLFLCVGLLGCDERPSAGRRVANKDLTTELLAIAERETYCHSGVSCSDVSIGTVRTGLGGPAQCFEHNFGPTGQPARYSGLSFQAINGQCYSKNSKGETYVSANRPSPPVDGYVDLPATWTGVSCYPDTGCLGPRSAVVYNWEDCRHGRYPVWEGVPESIRVNAKSYFWGGTCFTINLVGKTLTSTPVAMKQATPSDKAGH